MHRYIRDNSGLHAHVLPAPIVVLAVNLLDDVSRWCARMATINRHQERDDLNRGDESTDDR